MTKSMYQEPTYTFAQYCDHGIGMNKVGKRDGRLLALFDLNDHLEQTLIGLRKLETEGLNASDLIPGIKYALDLIAEHRRKVVADK